MRVRFDVTSGARFAESRNQAGYTYKPCFPSSVKTKEIITETKVALSRLFGPRRRIQLIRTHMPRCLSCWHGTFSLSLRGPREAATVHMNAEQKQQLDEKGYVVLPDLMEPEFL